MATRPSRRPIPAKIPNNVDWELEEPKIVDAGQLLTDAAEIVSGSRQQTHGDKERSFQMIADLWSIILGTKVLPSQVAKCMVAMKMARSEMGETINDHYVDMAGYAGLAGELAQAEVSQDVVD